jgi:hypothetical protein
MGDDDGIRSGFGTSWLVRRSAAAGSTDTDRSGSNRKVAPGSPTIVQALGFARDGAGESVHWVGMLAVYGVSVLTFDSKSRRATSGPDGTPGCGWEERQDLATVPCERGGSEGTVDGGIAV